MKIKDLLTNTFLCLTSIVLTITASYLNAKLGESKSTFSLSSIFTFNASISCIYVLNQRNRLVNGDEKSIFLSKRIDIILIISQLYLGIILYLFFIKFWGTIMLIEVYIVIAVMLYGNYHTLSPMPSENVSFFFEDEEVWRKVRKLRGRLIFGFGLIGLLAVFYFSPNSLGIEYMYLGMMAITFVITYFYAKSQYFKKFNR
jgi:hypothetical protein